MSSQQHYISNELTHFVGRGAKTPDKQYATLIKILNEGQLIHPLSDGITCVDASVGCVPSVTMKVCPNAKLSNNEMFNPESVCFCDIPVGDLNIHIPKYSPFGLSFEKLFIVQHGGAPVYYIPKEAPVKVKMLARYGKNKAQLFDRILPELDAYFNIDDKTIQSLLSTDSPSIDTKKLLLGSFLKLHILSYIKFFEHDLPDDHEENYYFEREWRIVGRLEFTVSDIKRILMPESYARQFRKDFPEYYGQLTFVDLPNEKK
jgi:hypothetical protein